MKRILLLTVLFTGLQAFSTPRTALDPIAINNAIQMDSKDQIQGWLNQGLLHVDDKIPTQAYDQAPLIVIAAKHAALKVLDLLIQKKATLDARTESNETALMMACFFKDEGQDMNPGYAQHEKAARMLVNAGASLENIPDWWTPLAYAAYQGHEKIISFLLSRGARVDSYAKDGKSAVNTPLMMSAMNGTLMGTIILLRAGADAKIINSRGKTASMLAEQYGNNNMLPYLTCAERLQPGQIFSQVCE